MHPLSSLLATIGVTVAPVATDTILSPGVVAYMGAIIAGLTLWRLIVAPLQKMARRIERLPYIEHRLRNLENELGVRPPADPAAK